jgi:moderate conductance mechanosensitive channel
MIGRLLLLALATLAVAALCGAGIARAQQQPAPAASAQPPLTPTEARHVIDTLQDPQQRAALIRDLQAIAKALPPAPATKPAPAAAVALAPDGLGAQMLGGLSRWENQVAGDAVTTLRAITAAPGLWHWANGIAADPARRRAMLNAAWRAALVVGIAFLLEWLARHLVSRSIAALARHAPAAQPRDAGGSEETAAASPNGEWRLLRRLPLALARLALDLVPVGVFWATASLFAGLAQDELTRLTILAVVNAYAASRVIVAVGRMFASPDIGRLRLLHINDRQAAWLVRWLRRITVVAVFGAAAIEVAGLFGLHPNAVATLGRLVALIVAILAGIVVLRSRRAIERRLRAVPEADGDGLARWRNGFAAVWHHLTLIGIAAAWIVWSAGAASGFNGLRVLLGSIAIVIAARFAGIVALGTVDRAFRLSLDAAPAPGAIGAASRAARYDRATRIGVSLLIGGGTAVMLLQFWGADAFGWFRDGGIGARLASAAATVALAAIAAIVVWESANAQLERRLARLSAAGSAGHAARLRTLLPLLRAALLVAVLTVVGLTALSEVGIDIAPLLASAGIVGIAVGFGSQKLVQDVITGMFVLFENAIQVGDAVTVAGLSGTVEQLSLRNIWLRGGDGTVHIIPFSAVTSISNSNRGLGNAQIAVTIAYQEDSDRVFAALCEVAAGMRGEEAFAALMLGDPQLWIDAVKAWGVVISGQIACTDSGRWAVQHEFNRRMHERFQELGIALSDYGYGGSSGTAPAQPA